MRFDNVHKVEKTIRDRSPVKLFMSSAIRVDGLKETFGNPKVAKQTTFWPSVPNDFLRLNLILQEKEALRDSDLIHEEN